ncbi:MAG: hypothetical protein HKN70_13015 [Gammaproteobacteria bacterium]|nr:hypothetical protein [Gammaproteobacteria bacterium]
MDKILRCLIVAVLASTGASAMACSYPGDPDFVVPDGSTATKEQMIDTQQLVKAYVKTIEEYLGCLDRNLAAAGDQSTEEQRAIHTLRYNAAVDSMEMIADKFNLSLRDYKAEK